ncbi:ribonuclease R [Vulgatibacter sp.]|uniref:ribonuclease R n=1 Tax=Vulgatibacter sp. TaxID=1971226 RepID=UPI0035636B7B
MPKDEKKTTRRTATKGDATKGGKKPVRTTARGAAKAASAGADAAAKKQPPRTASGAAKPAAEKKAPARKAAAAKPAAEKKAPARKAAAAKPAAEKKPPARKAAAAKPAAEKKAPARKAEAAKPAAEKKAPARKAAAAKPAAEKKAPARKAEAAKAAAEKKAPARKAEAAKAAAEKKAPARKAEAAKPAAEKKAPARKAEAAKPAAEKKAPARKAAAAKPAAEKKAPARKAEAAKAAAEKKAPARKAEAAKPAAEKKAPARKAEAAKPAPEKKAPSRKAAAAKPAAEKAPARKAEAAKPAAEKKAPARKAAAAKPAPAAPPAAIEAAPAPEAAAPPAARAKTRADRRTRRAGETEAAREERRAAGRRKVEAEQQAAAERKAERRRKVEAEQEAAAERKAERRRKAEAEQQASAERKTARRRAGAEQEVVPERKAARRRGKPAAVAPVAAPGPAPEPSPAAELPHRPPTPIVEGPVEGKGRHMVADPLAVAELLGDAADTAAPLSEVLPPVEPDEAWRLEHERRLAEKEQRRVERQQRQAAERAARKAAREAAMPAPPERVSDRGAEVIGTITVRPEGYGFLKRQEGPPGDDIFLPPDELRGVMDGDRLRVRIVRGKFGRDAGQLLDVLERRRRHLVGTFYRRGRTTYVTPADPTLPRFVSVRAAPDLAEGQVVKVGITQYPEQEGFGLLGDVEKVIGRPGDPIVEVLEVAYSHGFAEDFPADVRDESELIPEHVTEEDRVGRRDLSGLRLVTIDGEDARDFDDAVYVERRAGGFRLVVAIADVAHYVREGSRLDEEALNRATSVYFPNHVLPMLPERLSNGICSLNPRVDRLCMVADITFDSSGRPLEAEVYEGVMWSHARCTYEQVARILQGEIVPDLANVHDDLLLAGELARKLRERRIERGSLDFDLPEAKPILDGEMNVVEIARRDRNDAHRLVEEFMLAANEAVARYFGHRGLPTVYRVHGEPDPTKLENFVNLAQAVGYDFSLEAGITPVRLGEWLRRIEGSPQQKALNTLLLRSMMQAVYTPENIGHFGLGAEHYLHFTSPIRRYPDLIVHRLLKEHWARAGKVPHGDELDAMEARLDELAAQSSTRERAAMEAEREIDAFFKCLFVQDKVGEIFDATIVSITDFGFFAELADFPVDGLVRAEELGTQWELDHRQHRLVFGSGFSFGVGEKVQVEIAGVDLVKRQIGFVLVTDQNGEEVLQIRPRASGRPQRAGGAPREERGARDQRRAGGAPAERERGPGRPGGGRREDRGPGRFGGGRRDDRGPGRGRAPDGGGFRGGPPPAAAPGGEEAGETRSLTEAIDRLRERRKGQHGRGPAPAQPPPERRGSRFAAGDRQAAWGPRTGGPPTPGGESPEGGKRKGKGRKQRPGRKERQARRRR